MISGIQFFGERRGQVTIYVILAIVLVAGIVLFFVFRGNLGATDGIPEEVIPVFDYYLTCIEEETRIAVELAGTQGGYVFVPDYAPGSEYAPFSSHLNFLGFPVPYWFYVSGNGFVKEQVPSHSEIESQIGQFVEEGLEVNCDFRDFIAQGYQVQVSDPIVNVDLEDESVNVQVSSEMLVSRGDVFASRTEHGVSYGSKLGKFYNLALEVYDKQRQEAFLENYAVDVLRLYAPVDGVEIQCGPEVWSTLQVQQDLKAGLAANIGTIKLDGNYYDIQDEKREYFVVNQPVDEQVNLIYSERWPTKVEIYGEGVDDSVMVAEPVGTQAGLGALGFCYVPYHYVYDLSFPVLIQFYNNEEIFQFPVVVVVDNNVPRVANLSSSLFTEEEDFDLCQFYTEDVEVNVYDINLNPVNANISYECFNQRCRLGETIGGQLDGAAPACYNGYLHLRAEGYADKRQLFSSNEENFADVILEREYDIEINLKVDGRDYDRGTAVISFAKDDGTVVSAAWPEINSVALTEGAYEVSVYVYGNSSLTIPATTKTQCGEVPKKGLLGLFGGTEEKCINVNIPATELEFGLVGGGKNEDYLLESQLSKGMVDVEVRGLPSPRSLEEMQQNFETFETRGVVLNFDG